MTLSLKQDLLMRSGNACEACGTKNDIGPGGKPSGSRLYIVEHAFGAGAPSEYDVLCDHCRATVRRYQPVPGIAGQMELFE